tara:strand:+ start:1124 stop:1291 length:168 start_codon:yes stop_codon:yes gene_type:complete
MHHNPKQLEMRAAKAEMSGNPKIAKKFRQMAAKAFGTDSYQRMLYKLEDAAAAKR